MQKIFGLNLLDGQGDGGRVKDIQYFWNYEKTTNLLLYVAKSLLKFQVLLNKWKLKMFFFTSLSRKKRTNILMRFPFGLFRPLLFARASSAWGSCLLNSLKISKRSCDVYQHKSYFFKNVMNSHSWYSRFVHKAQWKYLKLFQGKEGMTSSCLKREIYLQSSSSRGWRNFIQEKAL